MNDGIRGVLTVTIYVPIHIHIVQDKSKVSPSASWCFEHCYFPSGDHNRFPCDISILTLKLQNQKPDVSNEEVKKRKEVYTFYDT